MKKRIMAILAIILLVLLRMPVIPVRADEGLHNDGFFWDEFEYEFATGGYMDFDKSYFDRMKLSLRPYVQSITLDYPFRENNFLCLAFKTTDGRSENSCQIKYYCYYVDTDAADPSSVFVASVLDARNATYNYPTSSLQTVGVEGIDIYYTSFYTSPVSYFDEETIDWHLSYTYSSDPYTNGKLTETYGTKYFECASTCIVDYYLDICYSDLDILLSVDLSADSANVSEARQYEQIAKYFDTGELDDAAYVSEGKRPHTVYDNTLGFSTGAFTARRYFDSRTNGCENIIIQYAPTQATKERMASSGNQWYLEVDMTFNAQLAWMNNGLLTTEANHLNTNSDITIRFPIDPIDCDREIINIVDLFGYEGSERYDIVYSSIPLNEMPQMGFSMNMHDFCCLYSDCFGLDTTGSMSFSSFLDSLSTISQYIKGGAFVQGGSYLLKQCISDTLRFGNFDVNITGCITDGITRSSTGVAYVDMLSGINNSYTSDIDGSGNNTSFDGWQSGRSEYKVDNRGDTYYYDYGNNTVTRESGDINVSVESIDLIHRFANTLSLRLENPEALQPQVYVYNTPIQSGENDPNITIEDDDYSRQSIIESIKSGYELLDNTDTGEKGDGILRCATDIIFGAAGGWADMIGFGLASTIAVSIIRNILRR